MSRELWADEKLQLFTVVLLNGSIIRHFDLAEFDYLDPLIVHYEPEVIGLEEEE